MLANPVVNTVTRILVLQFVAFAIGKGWLTPQDASMYTEYLVNGLAAVVTVGWAAVAGQWATNDAVVKDVAVRAIEDPKVVDKLVAKVPELEKV